MALKKFIFLIILLFFIQMLIFPRGNKDSRFYLASGVDNPSYENRNLISSEEGLTYYFRGEENAYLYLLLFSPEDQIKWYFPNNFNEFFSTCLGKDYYLPDKRFWETKRIGGVYKLYVIVTPIRWKLLEQGLKALSENEVLDKKIKSLVMEQHRYFTQTSNIEELPLVITGSFRNTQSRDKDPLIDILNYSDRDSFHEELKNNAILISNRSFYIQKVDLKFDEK